MLLLLRRRCHRSLIAGRGFLQTGQEVPELAERLNGNRRLSPGERRALQTEHPAGKRTEGLVRTFTDEMFSVPIFHPLNHTERLTKKRMPTIVNGGDLQNVRIM